MAQRIIHFNASHNDHSFEMTAMFPMFQWNKLNETININIVNVMNDSDGSIF